MTRAAGFKAQLQQAATPRVSFRKPGAAVLGLARSSLPLLLSKNSSAAALLRRFEVVSRFSSLTLFANCVYCIRGQAVLRWCFSFLYLN